MRLVMDVLFCETVEFRLRHTIVMRAQVAPSQEDVLRRLMIEVGLELIDYGSFTVQPLPPVVSAQYEWPIPMDGVSAYSKAHRERAERAAARR